MLAAGAKQLAMSGWEDLIEEASADLERVEGHVCASSQRLVDLESQQRMVAEAVAAANRQLLCTQAAVQQEELSGKVRQSGSRLSYKYTVRNYMPAQP